MANNNAQPKLNIKEALLKFTVKTLPALAVSLVLLLGGVWLLALRIPGWSLIFGLPAVQIGIIFLIFTFDEIVRTRVSPDSFHLISCSVCGKPTLVPEWEKEEICDACQREIGKKLLKTKKS